MTEGQGRKDDPTQTKVFMLAGFNSNLQDKAALMTKIRGLGGRVVDGNKWRDECTHVIAADYREYMEKVMGALVAGRWVLTRRYVERSHAAGQWSPNTAAFVAHESVMQHRNRFFRMGGIFKDLKTVLLMENSVKRGVYTRIVRAGGGEVHEGWTVGDLVANQPGKEDLNLVVVDPGILSKEDPRHQQFLAWLQFLTDCGRSDTVPHVYYKFLFTMVTEAKPFQAEQFSIFRSDVVEMARKDGNLDSRVDQNLLKRSASVEQADSLAKRLKPNNPNPASGPATKFTSTIVPANVVTLDSDSDDDIMVLEQKLTRRQGALGARRTYVDKTKPLRKTSSKPYNEPVIDLSDSDSEIVSDHPSTIPREESEIVMEVDQDIRDDMSDGDVSTADSRSVDQDLESEGGSRRSSVVTPDNQVTVLAPSQQIAEGQGSQDLPSTPAALRLRPAPQISLGLQAAIQALQQTPTSVKQAGKNRAAAPQSSPRSADSEELKTVSLGKGRDECSVPDSDGTDDDIEVLETKPGIKANKPREKTSKLDSRARLFQAKLKDLQMKQKTDTETVSEDRTITPPPEEVAMVVEMSPVALPSSPMEVMEGEGNRLLDRIVGSILERQHMTDECLAVGNVTCRTIKFDKHKEGKRRKTKVQPVESDVKEEFYQKLQMEAEEGEDSLREEVGLTQNYLSSLKYLSCSTSLTSHPTSAILHSLLVFYLLEQPSSSVRLQAYSYLDQFLFLHLAQDQDRVGWLVLVLSACRASVGEQEMFDRFSLESSQDLGQCWGFFKLVLTRYQDLASDLEGKEATSGPELLFEFLVKLVQKDFELWWKHYRKTSHKDNRTLSYPLLYYLLDGSRSLSTNLTKTVVGMYQVLLGQPGRDLGPTRRLISLSALLVSHLDCQQGQATIYSGTKLELAGSLQTCLTHLPVSDLQTELCLMQPPWLAWLVAKRLIMKLPGATKLNTLTDLVEKMDQLGGTVQDQVRLVVGLEVFGGRLTSSCHLHTIHRTHWIRSGRGGEEEEVVQAWRMMDRLSIKGTKVKSSVRFKSEVAVRTASLVEDVSTLTKFGNHQRIMETSGLQDCALQALIFRMTSALEF